jgi:predicted dehydrogenase
MNRRQFLGTAVATAVMGGRVRGQGQAIVAGRKIKAGFLGGSHSHGPGKWRLVRESPHYELVGMAEKSPRVRAEYAERGARFLEEEALVSASDVVFVESDVAEHGVHGLMALRAGKHVHVEKPPSDNLADVVEMVRLAREQGLVLQTGYMWRYHPGIRAIFEAVRSGWLGEVYLVRGMIGNQLAEERRPEWAQFAGGTLFELGSHLIDGVVRLLGEPESVTPFLRRDGPVADDLKDNTLAVFQFPRALGMVLSSNLQPNAGRQRELEVFGTLGSATLRPMEPPVLEIDLTRAAGPYAAGRQVVPMPAYERYAADVEDLAACIRGEATLPVTLEEEVRVQKWLLRACHMQA